MNCNACGAMMAPGSAYCPTCGAPSGEVYTPPPSAPQSSHESSFAPSVPVAGARQVYEVASAYRLMVTWLGYAILAHVAVQVFTRTVRAQDAGMMAGLLWMALALFSLVGFVLILTGVYNAVKGMGSGSPLLYVLGIFVPCVGLLVLLVVANQANGWLSSRGVPSSLFGPTAETVERLRREAGA